MIILVGFCPYWCTSPKCTYGMKKCQDQIHTVHSCISCSLVASLMTRMFSLRADSCCCCLSFSSDSFSPVMSLAETVEEWKERQCIREDTHFNISLHQFNCKKKKKYRCTYNINQHILSPGLGHKLHAVSTWRGAMHRERLEAGPQQIEFLLTELYVQPQRWHLPCTQLFSGQGLHVRFTEANLRGEKRSKELGQKIITFKFGIWGRRW